MTKNNVPWVCGLLTLLIAAGTSLWGWYGWLVVIWCACMALDFITGCIAAAKHREWSSSKARDGLFHKLGMLVALAVAVLLDVLIVLLLKGTGVKLPFHVEVIVSPLVLGWYSLTELGSILENAVRMGAPVPGWLRKMLKISVEAVDKSAEDMAGKD